MECNAPMKELLGAVAVLPQIHPALTAIIDEGFDVRAGCYFLAALLRKATNVSRSSFIDCTGYECFVNSIHIEDYDDQAPLAQAVQFISRVFSGWRTWTYTSSLVAIVGGNESSVVVKFHAKRPTERWLSDDIELYDDPTMSVESSEDFAAMLTSLRRRV
ncbi:hypothetical protein AKI39_14640 [Bordetella sp. H567]|nr:hypothetical protein AKI39_14640 [Bordetella sp. H567]